MLGSSGPDAFCEADASAARREGLGATTTKIITQTWDRFQAASRPPRTRQNEKIIIILGRLVVPIVLSWAAEEIASDVD